MSLNPRGAVLLAFATLSAACGEREEAALRVGEVTFTEEQVARLTAEDRAYLADLAALAQVIALDQADSLIAPMMRRSVERARREALPYHLGARAGGIGEPELRAAYAEDPEWELEVRHIVRLVPEGSTAAEREAARAAAADAERRAKQGSSFARLAGELSQEPGAARRGGLLERGREGSWVDPFWEAAIALQPGEISEVIETEYGYHVLRLEDRQPVPFEEANRLRILQRIVPAAQARAAMEAWVEQQPPVILDPPAVVRAREHLRRGEAPDTLVIATGPEGGVYTAADLAASWASLTPGERASLDRGDDLGFGRWVESEVRETFWSGAARGLGVEPPPGSVEAARAGWLQRIAGWGRAYGFLSGMVPAQIASAALQGVGDRGQEARIARAEIPALRPLLRRIYPVEAPFASSSDIP